MGIDFQRVAEDVRVALDAAGGPDSVTLLSDEAFELLRDSAADYAAAVEEINERLRDCGKLLQKGLRSEALQLCELEPNLLEVVAILDLPELPHWIEKLRAYDLAVPPAVNLEVATELNAAYAIEQPLRAILRKHRIQALARSPLPARIQTLRELAALDGDNLVWQDDLRSYERARHEQLQAEAEHASRRGDLATLETLVQEIDSEDWLETPLRPTVKRIHQAHQRVQREVARATLSELEPQLNDAFAALDVDEGRRLRMVWDAHLPHADFSPDDPLLESAAPALEWLDGVENKLAQERDFEAGVRRLEEALDDGATLAELERLGQAVLRFDRPLPPLLAKRYETRLANLQMAAQRRRHLLIGSLAAAVLLLAAFIAWTIQWQRDRREVQAQAALVERLLDEEKLDEAARVLAAFETSSPRLAQRAAIVAARIRLDDLAEQEDRRLAQYHEHLQRAESAGLERPDRVALEQAKGLAKSPAEQEAVAALERAIEQYQRQQQLDREQRFRDRLEELAGRLGDLDASTRIAPAALVDQTTVLERELEQLTRANSNINAALRSSADAIRQRVQRLKKVALDRQRAEGYVSRITQATGNADLYCSVLERFADELPDSPRSSDFRRVIEEPTHLSCISACDRLEARWQAEVTPELSPQEAKSLIEAVRALIDKHPDLPHGDAIDERVEYLEAIVRRDEPSAASLTEPLEALLSDRLMQHLWMVEEGATGFRYYVDNKSEIRREGAVVQIEYIVAFDGSKRKLPSILATRFDEEGAYRVDEAPQSQFARRALRTLAGDASWEETYLAMIDDLRQSMDDIEPIVTVLLLRRILETACEGSYPLRSAFRRHLAHLEAPSLDFSVPWLDPADAEGRRVSESARELLQRLPDLQAAAEEARRKAEVLASTTGWSYRWVGWLGRDGEGNWTAFTKETPPDGPIFTAVPDGGKPRMIQVGQSAGGSIELSSEQASLVEGRPLLVPRSARFASPGGVTESRKVH